MLWSLLMRPNQIVPPNYNKSPAYCRTLCSPLANNAFTIQNATRALANTRTLVSKYKLRKRLEVALQGIQHATLTKRASRYELKSSRFQCSLMPFEMLLKFSKASKARGFNLVPSELFANLNFHSNPKYRSVRFRSSSGIPGIKPITNFVQLSQTYKLG